MVTLLADGTRSLRRIARRLLDPRTRTPSFAYKNEEMRRVDALAWRLRGRRLPVWEVNDKLDTHAWAGRLGVRVPRLLGEHPRPSALPWAAMPERFALKPVTGSASCGVYLLERRGAAWHDLASGRTLTSGAVEVELGRLHAQGAVSEGVLVEELVDDPRRPGSTPVDWKVLTFFGAVGVVMAKSSRVDDRGRRTVGWRLFDEHWTDLGRAAQRHALDPAIEPPVHAEELLAMARQVSSSVARPFLRVDLYDDVGGVVLGEITPEPGGGYLFRRDVDRAMGRLWEDAEARVLVRCAATGAMDAADSVLPESAPGANAPRG